MATERSTWTESATNLKHAEISMSPLAMKSLHSYCILHVKETMAIEQGNRASATIENALIGAMQVVVGQHA